MAIANAFRAFTESVYAQITKGADSKGYDDQTGPVGGDLHAFMSKFFRGHALGEVVYKLIRFRNKGNREDLEKAAAWCFLEWANIQPGLGCHAKGPVYTVDANGTKQFVPRTAGEREPEQSPMPDAYSPGMGGPFMPVGGGFAVGSIPKGVGPLEFAPTEMPTLKLIRDALTAADREALQAIGTRPSVKDADPVRLAALVCEEAGEAIQAALDMTRKKGTLALAAVDWVSRKKLRTELIQTCAMAAIAVAVLDERGL